MFIQSKNLCLSFENLSDENSNNRISHYYPSINNNNSHLSSSSSLSLSSDCSKQSLTTKIRTRRIDSLSSLSTTSLSSSITLILHALNKSNKQSYRKTYFKKNQTKYKNNLSSSSISRLTKKNNAKNEQDLVVISSPSYRNEKEINVKAEKQRKACLSKKTSLINKNFHGEKDSCDQSTQTNNYLFVREEYQYGNLRRVNSDLLDYIFIPFSK